MNTTINITMEDKYGPLPADQSAEFSEDNREQVEMDVGGSDEDSNQNVGSRDKSRSNYHHDREISHHSSKSSRYPSCIVEVTNISPAATLEQMTTLFGYLGKIISIDLHQSDQGSESNLKVCYIEYAKPSSVMMAQHLTNTVFIDRALVVLPWHKHEIPDRRTAIENLAASKNLTNFNPGVVSQATVGVAGAQMIATIDHKLTALGLPQYPQLPITTEPTRLEEIRRTVYIGNLDSTISPDQVMKFFNDIGEVKYIRLAGDDSQPTRFAFVEYTHQSSIANALQHNGSMLGSRSLKINHSNNAIVKPQPKFDNDDTIKRSSDNHTSHRHHSRSDRDRDRIRERDRYLDRRISPRRRSRSPRDRVRRSRSRDDSRSRDRTTSSRRRSRSRDSKRRRSKSRSRSKERSKARRRRSRRR